MDAVAYKFKVYQQNGNHEKRLSRVLSLCAEIYNHVLAVKKKYYALYKKDLSMYDMQAHITKMKHRCYQHWDEVSSQSIQEIVERIYHGYKRFIHKKAKRPPMFKSWRKYKSLTFKVAGWQLNGNEFIINKQQLRLRFHKSREIDGKIQTVTLKRDDCGDWWLVFIVRKEPSASVKVPMTGKTAGLDFGLKHFLTTDEGEIIESPEFLKQSLTTLRRKSRNLSKKVKGSNNRRRARLNLARFHRKVAYQRNEFHWRMAIRLAREFDVIFIEDLDIRTMQRLWGRKISDLAFSDFVRILEWACNKNGKKLVKIDRWEATTKTCSECEYKMDEIPLKVREWVCPCCGAHHDRDVNAAKNIKMVGTSTIAGGDVSYASAYSL